MTRARAGALTVLPSTMFLIERRRLVDLAATNRLPALYSAREFVDAGGLIAYGANFAASYRRAATYVDKILKGAKPGDLPVDQAAWTVAFPGRPMYEPRQIQPDEVGPWLVILTRMGATREETTDILERVGRRW